MNKVTAHLVYKLIITAVIIIAAGIGGWIIYNEFFSKNEGLKIADTANVVERITKIGEFTSVSYYEEQVLKNKKLTSFAKSTVGKYVKSDSADELILIASGHVRAGFDLQKVKAENISITGDSIAIQLPPAEIFDAIMNPSDFEVYVESGQWSHEEIQRVQHDGKVCLHRHAIEEGVLEKAKESGIRKLTALFKTFGFRAVNLTIQEQPTEQPVPSL